MWPLLSPTEALELLDYCYADLKVREFAVNCIKKLDDTQLNAFLIQLTQILKYEPYHFSALSHFLLTRALANRKLIGHFLFWHLKAELNSDQAPLQDRLLLEAYLLG